MALDARVFGRMAPSHVAKDVMSSPSLQMTPAPAQPADLVEHPNLANYYNALDSCYEILKKEIDPRRRLKVEEARTFFDSVISEFEDADTSAAQPMPTPQMPGQPPMPQAAPMAPPAGSLPTPPPPLGGDGGSVPGAPPAAA